MNETSQSPRPDVRQLGAFYTPPDVARTLASWALKANVGPLLDPSYGTCRFLDAALFVLREAGVRSPAKLLHGIDIDCAAAEPTTSKLQAAGALLEQFTHCDFFACSPEPRYAAVVGNPPYVRHQWISSEVRESVRATLNECEVKLSSRASLWAPFIIHAHRFVRPGGRMVMLLPGSALQAQYAQTVWHHLQFEYECLTLVRIGERLFGDALEESVVLFASGRGARKHRSVLTVQESTFATLQQELQDDSSLDGLRRRGTTLARARSTLSAQRLLASAAADSSSAPLGDAAKVRLGVVTGANEFFVRRPSDPLLAHIPADFYCDVVPSSSSLKGPRWDQSSTAAMQAEDARCKLLTLPEHDPGLPLVREIGKARRGGLHKRSKCQLRDPWWSLGQLEEVPDAFLPYMSKGPRGITVNQAESESLNGVHRIYWEAGADLRYALSTWTSLWALQVEQQARSYGGGVLKLEPGRAKDLLVFGYGDVAALAELEDTRASQGAIAARDFADQAVMVDLLGFNRAQVKVVRTLVTELAQRRRLPLRKA